MSPHVRFNPHQSRSFVATKVIAFFDEAAAKRRGEELS